MPKRNLLKHDPRIDQVDAHIGTRLKTRRQELGLSAFQLAELGAIKPRCLWEYERGLKAIEICLLWRFARILKTQVAYFFEGLPHHDNLNRGSASLPNAIILCNRALADVVHAYNRITPRQQRAVHNLLKMMTK